MDNAVAVVDDEPLVDTPKGAEGAKAPVGGRPAKTVKSTKKTENSDTTTVMVG